MKKTWGRAARVAIVAASLAPQQPVTAASISDKLGHYLAYFALALAVSGISTPRRLWRHMLACLLLGALLEPAMDALQRLRHGLRWILAG